MPRKRGLEILSMYRGRGWQEGGGGWGGGVFEMLMPQCTLSFMFTYTFLTFFSCFSLSKMFFFLFHFFFVMKFQIFATEY